MDSSSSPALQGCVSSLRTSMQLLESSIDILDSGVHDYPRLSKVLQTTRVSVECAQSKAIPLAQRLEGLTSTSALRTRLRTLPPHRARNPPLLPRARAQRPAHPRRSATRPHGAARAVPAGQSGAARGPAGASETGRRWSRERRSSEAEHCWSGGFGQP